MAFILVCGGQGTQTGPHDTPGGCFLKGGTASWLTCQGVNGAEIKDDTIIAMEPALVKIASRLPDDVWDSSFPAISIQACSFINAHIKGMYILSHLHGILGMRGPKMLNGWGSTLKRKMFISLHGKDPLADEVLTAATQLGIPALKNLVSLFNDDCSSRC